MAIDRLIDELDRAFGGGPADPEQARADGADMAFPLLAGDTEEQEESEVDGQPLFFDDEYSLAPDASTVWAPEPGFWQVDEQSGAKAPPGRHANGNVRYYVGGAAAFLLVAAGTAFLALQSTRDALVSAPPVDTRSPATAAAVAGEEAVDRQPPITATAGQPYRAAPARDEIDALGPGEPGRLAVLPEYAAVPDEPAAGDRRVEAHEPLGHGPVAENLRNQGVANALPPGSPLPIPAVSPEALADPAAIEADAAEMAVLVETTTIPVATAAVTTAWVNLRAGPDNGADIIAVLEAGAALEVIECDRWCNVVADGTHGWIHRDFLDGDMLPERTEPVARAAGVAPFTATATAWLRVYDSPFEDGLVATSFRAGSEIFIVGCDANWCETRFGSDRRGWVDRRLLEVPEDITERQIPPLPPITRDEAAGL